MEKEQRGPPYHLQTGKASANERDSVCITYAQIRRTILCPLLIGKLLNLEK